MPNVDWWNSQLGAEEEQSVVSAIRTRHISQGELTEELERQFAAELRVPYVIATTSGSVALFLSLWALGVGPGDEVIVPNRTFIATAHAAVLLGAKVVLVDVTPGLPIMDTDALERAITPRTKAIMPVHLCGRAVDMDAIDRLARAKGIAVVEDACQALFSMGPGRFLGTLSDAGCFSLGMAKLMATGQGGLVVTHRADIYERIKLLRTHGLATVFDATAYVQPGFNFKFTDIQAAIGLVQLSRKEEKLAHVQAVYERYRSGLEGNELVQLIPVMVEKGELPLYVEALCADRAALLSALQTEGITARPFLPDLHTSPYLESSNYFPNSKIFHEQGMYLPSGPSQAMENVDRVIETLWKLANKIGSC